MAVAGLWLVAGAFMVILVQLWLEALRRHWFIEAVFVTGVVLVIAGIVGYQLQHRGF